MSDAVLKPGTVLAGKLRVVRLLGSGGMGAVYEIEHTLTKHRRALKLLHAQACASPEIVARFVREASAAGRIGNPHIVEVFDAGSLETGAPYVVMELCAGETLGLLAQKGKLELPEMCDLVGQACEGIQAAHDAGVVHRDLKPENLFVTAREGRPFVKILDFGVSKWSAEITGGGAVTLEGAAVGTPLYMAPEQAWGAPDVDLLCDVYALGVILYTCAAGVPPFRASSLPELAMLVHEGKPPPLAGLRPELPAAFHAIVARAMAREKPDRVPSARALAEELRAIGAGHGAATTTEPPADGEPAPASEATRPGEGSGPEGDLDRRLGARYRVTRLLGRGGMGAVYLAEDHALAQRVALKLVGARPGGGGFERLRDEVRLAQRVAHPNVCRTFDLEEEGGLWFVKMEYVEGETLGQRIAREGRLPVADAVAVARAVAAGLRAAHAEGVVHRDVKPGNILLEEATGRVVLTDFGLACAPSSARAADGAGTPAYMAPEQARGDELDGRADLYALGCVLYHALVGAAPFPAATAAEARRRHREDAPPDPRAARPEVPAWLGRLTRRLLAKEPRDRPAGAAEVAALLEGPERRRWRRIGLGAALIAAALGAGAAGAHRYTSRAREWRPALREHLPLYEENASLPQISPDGKLLAYASDREVQGRFRVYVAPIEGGPARAVTPPAMNAGYARWARDGAGIYFTDVTTWTARRAPLDGGEPTVVAEAATVEDCGGGRLAITTLGAPGCESCLRIVVREPDGREREVERGAPQRLYLYARCDREGRRLVYSSSELLGGAHAPSDLWVLPLDGGASRRLTDAPLLQNRNPTFTPDGQSVVYSVTRDGITNLWELPLDGRPPVQRTFGPGPDVEPDVAPDGRTAVFDVDVTSKALFALGPDGEKRRLSATRDDLRIPTVPPDGREVIAVSRWAGEDRVVAFPVDGGEPRTLAAGAQWAVVTLDGGEVLYSVDGPPPRVMAVSRAGGAPRLVAALPGVVTAIFPGPDGLVHLTLRHDGALEAWRAPIAGGVAERSAPLPWYLVAPAPRGGRRAAFVIRGTHFEGHLLAPGAPLDDPAAPVIEGNYLQWDADGESVVYRHGAEVRRRSLRDGSERVLVSLPYELSSFFPSPDQRTLYFTGTVSHARRQVITNFAERPR